MNQGFVIAAGAPATVADPAAAVGAAGWDGALYRDGVDLGRFETCDSWVTMAVRAGRVRIGALPAPRPAAGRGSTPARG